VSLDRMLAKPIERIGSYTDEKAVEDDLFKTASWVKWQKDEGKVEAEVEDVAAVLVAAAVATGFVDEERARRQVERGWTWVKGEKKAPGRKSAPTARSLPPLRTVQTAAAPTPPPDVDRAIGLLGDPRVKAKLQSIIWDVLESFHLAAGKKGGGAA
jgi:hypothetical protein